MTLDHVAQVETLMARFAIRDALARYCRGLDRVDKNLVLSAFHPDARANYGAFSGTPAELVERLLGGEGSVPQSSHFMGNELTTVGGDAADSESYFYMTHRVADGDALADLRVFGRYLDRFEKRNGEWKIAERTVMHDMDRIDPVGQQWNDPMKQALLKGVRSNKDASYELLRLA